MPLRTNIHVDADPAALQASVAALNKYRETIQKSSSQWAKYGESVKQSLKTTHDLTAQLQQHSATLEHVSTTQRRFGDAAKGAGSIFATMAKNTGSIANNLAHSATSLFSILSAIPFVGFAFSAIGALVGLGGGLFGLERLASSVTASRKDALGLGVEYGRMSAFDLNFSRYGDAHSILGAVSGGLYDVTSPAYVGLLASGASRKGDAAQTAIDLLKRLPQIFAGTPDGLVGPKAEALGITQILSVREIIAYLRSTPEERQSQIEHYEQDSQTLSISRDAQLKWAKFDTALARAGSNIETILADQLVPLSEPLQHISSAFVDIIGTFAQSKTVGEALHGVEESLEWFAGQIGSGEFKANAGRFLEGLNVLRPEIKRTGLFLAAMGRIGWFGVKVAGDKTYNPTFRQLIGDILGHGYPGENESRLVPERNRTLRLRAAPTRHSLSGTHGREQRDPYANSWYGDDPSIRARQKMQRPQTTSYLDQFQGIRDTKQIIVLDQTHNNVTISAA